MVPVLNGVMGKEGKGVACVGVSMHFLSSLTFEFLSLIVLVCFLFHHDLKYLMLQPAVCSLSEPK